MRKAYENMRKGRKLEYSAQKKLQSFKDKETNNFLNGSRALLFLVRFSGYESKFQINLVEAKLNNFSRDNGVRAIEHHEGEDQSLCESGCGKSVSWK